MEGLVSLRPTDLIVLGRVVVAVAPHLVCNRFGRVGFRCLDAIVKGLHHTRFHVIIRFTVSIVDTAERLRHRSAT